MKLIFCVCLPTTTTISRCFASQLCLTSTTHFGNHTITCDSVNSRHSSSWHFPHLPAIRFNLYLQKPLHVCLSVQLCATIEHHQTLYFLTPPSLAQNSLSALVTIPMFTWLPSFCQLTFTDLRHQDTTKKRQHYQALQPVLTTFCSNNGP